MAVDHSSDLLPILDERGFDIAMRGYDKRQVDHYLIQIEDELRAASTERDIAAARNAELSNQLTSHQAQIDSLRRQLRAATDPVTEDNVESTVRSLMQDAKRKARQIHADADIYAGDSRKAADEAAARILLTARAEADQLVADATQRVEDADEMFRRRSAEAEQLHAEAVAAGERSLAQTRADEDRLTQEAAHRRNALDEAAAADRRRLTDESARTIAENEVACAERLRIAEEDFEITLRERRSKEIAESDALLTGARADSESMLSTAKADSEATISAAKAEAALTVTSATNEAEALLAEAEAAAVSTVTTATAEAGAMLAAAKNDSESMLSTAKAEAEAKVNAAESQAADVVAAAERKATNILGIARGKVRSLDTQRTDLHKELSSLSSRLSVLVAETPEFTPLD